MFHIRQLKPVNSGIHAAYIFPLFAIVSLYLWKTDGFFRLLYYSVGVIAHKGR
jgi:hypothetical protein